MSSTPFEASLPIVDLLPYRLKASAVPATLPPGERLQQRLRRSRIASYMMGAAGVGIELAAGVTAAVEGSVDSKEVLIGALPIVISISAAVIRKAAPGLNAMLGAEPRAYPELPMVDALAPPESATQPSATILALPRDQVA